MILGGGGRDGTGTGQGRGQGQGQGQAMAGGAEPFIFDNCSCLSCLAVVRNTDGYRPQTLYKATSQLRSSLCTDL